MSAFAFEDRYAALVKAKLEKDSETKKIEAERVRLAREVEATFKHYLALTGTHLHQNVSREYGFTFNGSNLSVKVEVQPDLRFSFENMTPSNVTSKIARHKSNLTAEELTDALLHIVHRDL